MGHRPFRLSWKDFSLVERSLRDAVKTLDVDNQKLYACTCIHVTCNREQSQIIKSARRSSSAENMSGVAAVLLPLVAWTIVKSGIALPLLIWIYSSKDGRKWLSPRRIHEIHFQGSMYVLIKIRIKATQWTEVPSNVHRVHTERTTLTAATGNRTSWTKKQCVKG